MEPWREIWRSAVAGCLGRDALCYLYRALAANDPRLIRGANTEPPVCTCFAWDDPGVCVGACPLAYGLWLDGELTMAVEVERAFQDLLEEIAAVAGSKLAIAPLLDWIDHGDWGAVRLELLGEIGRVLTAAPRGQALDCPN